MPRVSLVFHRHAHHARWSGYSRLVEWLAEHLDARVVRPQRLPATVRRWVAERPGAYGPLHLALDLAASRRLVLGSGEVVHCLSGEDERRIAPRVRGLARRRGNRLVATIHQPPAMHRWYDIDATRLEAVDHLIALGPGLARHLSDLVGAERVSLAWLGADVDAWRPGPEPRDAVPSCLSVGSWLRDFGLLRDTVAAVRDVRPDVRFVAVVSPGDEAELADCPGLTVRTRIPDVELRDLYRRSWIHLLPLADAVANNALVEGMACAIPTVAPAVGDVESYTGDAAVLTPPGDPVALAGAVLGLVEDSRRRADLARRARARAQELSVTAAARRHAEIYARVAAR